MATIINTPPGGGSPDTGNSAAGWVAIVAIVLLVLGGLWFLNQNGNQLGQGTESAQQGNNGTPPPSNTFNTTNTTLNATTTVNNSTTTDED